MLVLSTEEMRYAIRIATLVLAIAFTGATTLNWGRTQAVQATAVSSIAELRGEGNVEQCQEVERHVSKQIGQLIDGQRVPLALGSLAVCTSLAALIAEARKEQKA